MENRFNRRFDIIEERLRDMEDENKTLKKEIASLKKQNIDYQEELSSVKSQMNLLDRKYRTTGQTGTTSYSEKQSSSLNEDLSDVKKQIKSMNKKMNALESSLTSSASENPEANKERLLKVERKLDSVFNLERLLNRMHLRLQSRSELEKEVCDVKQRLGSLESLQGLKTRCAFNVTMYNSKPLSEKRLTAIDKCIEFGDVNPCDIFKADDCSCHMPVDGMYGLDLEIDVDYGQAEFFMLFGTPKKALWIARSDMDKKKTSRLLLFKLSKGEVLSIAARTISGEPTITCCLAGWLVEPL